MNQDRQFRESAMELIAQMTIVDMSKRFHIHPNEAIARFMESETAEMLFDERTGLYMSGPSYILNRFIKERGLEPRETGAYSPQADSAGKSGVSRSDSRDEEPYGRRP